jgi:hypothetical protein
MEFGLLMKAALMVFGGRTARCSLATRIPRMGSERDGIRAMQLRTATALGSTTAAQVQSP